MGFIAFLWIVAIVVTGIVLLALAKAESSHNALSSRIPDTVEWERRHARHEEERRGSNRVVAPGLRIAPRSGARPGSTADDPHNRPVVTTSSSVVEVHRFSSEETSLASARSARPAKSAQNRTR